MGDVDDTPEVDVAAEWGETPTVLDVGKFEALPEEVTGDQITKPNQLAGLIDEAKARGREEGCRSCYEEGQADALIAMRSLLLEKGATNDHTAHVIAAVRQRLTKL